MIQGGRGDAAPSRRRFGDPALLFIASLLVVSESLDATVVTALAGRQVSGLGLNRLASKPEG